MEQLNCLCRENLCDWRSPGERTLFAFGRESPASWGRHTRQHPVHSGVCFEPGRTAAIGESESPLCGGNRLAGRCSAVLLPAFSLLMLCCTGARAISADV